MSTRITFHHREIALATLHEILTGQANGAEANPDQAILTFAELCLNIASGNPGESTGCVTRKSRQRITDLLATATAHCPADKPLWAASAEAVLHLSERLLGIDPTGETLRSLDPRTSVHRRRSVSCGTYSTPGFIADEMCRTLLQELEADSVKGVDVADLTLEAGHFALGLLARQPRFPVRFFGIDRDPSAIQLAQRIIGFANEQAGGTQFQFRTCELDSISDHLPRGWPRSFDAIIGNPPWKSRHATDAESLRAAFHPHLSGHFDVYLAFMLQAHQYLKPAGLLSMVVPFQFLFNQNAAKVRSLLLAHFDFLKLDVYPRRSFIEIPSVSPVSFLARRRPAEKQRRSRTVVSCHYNPLGRPDFKQSRTFAAATLWNRLPGKVFHPLAQREALFLVGLDKGLSLQEFGDLGCGAKLGAKQPTTTPQPFVGFHARHLRPFHACPRDAVSYRRNRRIFERTPPLKYVNRPKVLFQHIRCVTLAARLVAAQTGPGTLAASSASMFVPHEEHTIDFFEALLNSQFVNAWYKLRDLNPSVKLNVLAELPVVRDEQSWARVARIGREIAKIRRFQHQYLDSCAIIDEKDLLSTRFAKSWKTMMQFQESLNSEVFDLYELTSRQRSAVTWLSDSRVFER